MVDLRLWDALSRWCCCWRVLLVQTIRQFQFVGLDNSTHVCLWSVTACSIIKRHGSHTWYGCWTIKAVEGAEVLYDGFTVSLQGIAAPLIICQTFTVSHIYNKTTKKPVLLGKKWIYWNLSCICWLPYWEIYITGNAPYGTGMGTCTITVRCPPWYCPFFFTNHCLLFSYQFTLCMFDDPRLWKITGMVVGQVTVQVMTSWHFKRLPVW